MTVNDSIIELAADFEAFKKKHTGDQDAIKSQLEAIERKIARPGGVPGFVPSQGDFEVSIGGQHGSLDRARFKGGLWTTPSGSRVPALAHDDKLAPMCESACKKDPVFGVIGVQKGPLSPGG